MKHLVERGTIVAWLLLGSLVLDGASNWPQFRGVNGSGVAAERERPPLHFGPGTNELWKVKAPSGASSPSIWKDRIFLTGFEDGKLSTLCYDRRDGRLLWQKIAPAEEIEPFLQNEGSPAAATPCTDGKRVVSYFGSCGLIAYDFKGKELWRVPMPVPQQIGDFGSGTSPIIHEGVVILNRDMLSGSHLLAVDAKTGKTKWRAERPTQISSWGTPIIWRHDGRTEVVTAGTRRMIAYDFKTGGEKWALGGMPNGVCTTPVLGEGMLLFAGWSPGANDVPMPTFTALLEKQDKNGNGTLSRDEGDNFVKTLFTLWDMDSNGEVARGEWEARQAEFAKGENVLLALRPENGKPKVMWKQTRGLPYVPSPLYYKGLVYTVKDGGMVSCFDAATGKAHYLQERLGATGNYYPSPVAANGRIYLGSNEGKITVLAAGEKPEVLARCELGERLLTTPAVCDSTLYYRAAEHLWAFAEE